MTTPPPPTSALSNLKLVDNDEEVNPWTSKPLQDSNDTTSSTPAPLEVTNAPPPVAEPVFTPAPTPPVVNTEALLSEFDPLADQEQKEAQDAWATAESHPPKADVEQPQNQQEVDPVKETTPPRTPTKPTEKPLPESPTKATQASAFSATFANLARTFSRPRSTEIDPASLPTTSRRSGEHSALANPERTDSKGKATEAQFDFQKFLDQLKTRSAEPVAQYFRSFINHFSRRTFSVTDQVKLVQQFLAFIEPKMRECSAWKRESPEEFENTMEAMEKLVMNRIFEYTFTPQILASGRPVTTDDLEKDHILSQRIRLFGWVSETHLDIPIEENNEGFLNFAQQELLKINHYKAPRDKMICILNCCKVIFGLIRQLKKDEGADAFIPILILVVLQANPEHLLSNIEYIQRFRSPSKLQSEAGYYLSSLMGAVSFIETMDHTSLSNITQEQFEANVEEAIQALPPSPVVTPATPSTGEDLIPEPPKTPSAAPAPGEESASALQMPTPASVAEDTRKFLQRTSTLAQQTISKPLNAIGKILSDALDGIDDDGGRRPESSQWNHPDRIQQYSQDPRTPQTGGGTPIPIMQAPYKARVRPGSNSPSPAHTPISGGILSGGPPPLPPRGSSYFTPYPGASATPNRGGGGTPSPEVAPRNLEAEIGAIENAHRQAAKETVVQIFPTVDNEVIDMVLDANGGDLGRTIDALLEMSAGS
ncbi:hypothetical protein M408DRAFT_303717 [Serendipita vermifera MAFF 305830]|uniref:VPS9 domain-containing protein n=1 Tax=Serendipita vermifera MAFF 305830 TaxID=933852 RepID=A0A0C3BSX8_SERVB|nr:hypothetical protein M408DRAFT_303717 [Serendipita vermifera MAFF 305830]